MKCQKRLQVSITETFGLKILTKIKLICFIFSNKLVVIWFSGRRNLPLLPLETEMINQLIYKYKNNFI